MSGIVVAKATQGFTPASARPSCKNCKHGQEEIAERSPPYDTRSWRCLKGGFLTSALATCNVHEFAYLMRPKQ